MQFADLAIHGTSRAPPCLSYHHSRFSPPPTPLPAPCTDCCDGTDELSGCKNTCIEKNSAKRDALNKEINEYKAALDRKGQYASSANGVRENIKQRFQNVDSDLEKAEKELESLTGRNCFQQL